MSLECNPGKALTEGYAAWRQLGSLPLDIQNMLQVGFQNYFPCHILFSCCSEFIRNFVFDFVLKAEKEN